MAYIAAHAVPLRSESFVRSVSNEPRVLRVMIGSEFGLVVDALEAVISARPNMEVIGDAAEGRTAIYKTRHLQPDVLVLDSTIAHAYGPNVAPQIRMLCPRTRILIVDGWEESGYLLELLRLGVSGYVLAQSTPDTLLRGIEAVACGKNFLDPTLAESAAGVYQFKPKKTRCVAVSESGHNAAFETTPSVPSTGTTPPAIALTERECGVLRRTALGYANKEIALQIGLSVKTVETYKARAMEKLGFGSRVDIVRYAVQQEWFKKSEA